MGTFTANVLKPKRILAVTLDRPKTAALAFDKVYAPTETNVPADITPGFVWFPGPQASRDPFIKVQKVNVDGTEDASAIKVTTSRAGMMYQLTARKDAMFSALASQGYRPVEFQDASAQTYSPGNDRYIFAILDGLVGIDETTLAWEQVSEFRKDGEAFRAYQAMVQWFNRECKGMGHREAETHILSTYEKGLIALKKHGVMPVSGTLATLLGAPAIAWITQIPWVGGIASIVGGVAVMAKIYEASLQRKETRFNGPVAYIQKLNSLSGIRQKVIAEHRGALAAGLDMIREDL